MAHDLMAVSKILCGALLLAACPLAALAEDLPDPTRPPLSVSGPVQAADAVPQQTGLSSVIISKTRRAAIIDGQTIELGGKYGDARLIAVNEGGVVLRDEQGRKTLTMFPGVEKTEKKVKKRKPQAAKSVTGDKADKPARREEGK